MSRLHAIDIGEANAPQSLGITTLKRILLVTAAAEHLCLVV